MHVQLRRLLRRTLAAGFLTVATTLAIASAASASSRITGVTWTGSSASPTVTISGSGFGSQPPTSHALPAPPCNGTWTGLDYASALWFQDDTGNWTGGHGNGSSASSCVGLLISSWTKTSITLSFGSGYGNFGWVANSGDNFVWTVKGYVWGGLINYTG